MPENARLIGLKLRKAVRQLQYLLRALALVYSAARVWTVIWLVLLVLQGVLPAAQVVLTRALINGIVQALGGDVTWRALGPVLTTAIAVGLLILLAELLRTGSNWIRSVEGDIIQDHISSLVLRHSAQLDLAFYDSPDYYDRLHRARVEASYRPLALFESLGGLLQNAITFLSMLTVLVPYGPWLPLVLLASTLPALYVVLQQTVREHEWRQKTTADERRSWYYFGLLTAREAVPELRLFGLGEHFYALYNGIRRALRGQRASLIRAQAVSQFVAATFAILAAGGVLLWMGARALRGQATLGDLALFYQAFTQGQGLMRTLLHNMGQIYGHSLFLGNLFEFLALEPRITDPPAPEPLVVPLKEGIRFCDVRFRYPGSDRWALDGFDLTVPAGQVVAIVGPNGAGKSTLIRLLCRFYDPDSGRIELDGHDLRSLPLGALRRAISVLFQEPTHYQASMRTNIALSDIEAPAEPRRLEAAAEAAGAQEVAGRLAQGYDTPLGMWFESGTELSVGEWQRIALARAFFRQAPVIVLDEPTSAMDSWAEADWLVRFRALAEGRTAIVITHRFTTAMWADVTYVMEDGRVIEHGTHEELLALGGRYAASWRQQMQSQRRSRDRVAEGEAAR